jgi:hypothetical protein
MLLLEDTLLEDILLEDILLAKGAWIIDILNYDFKDYNIEKLIKLNLKIWSINPSSFYKQGISIDLL